MSFLDSLTETVSNGYNRLKSTVVDGVSPVTSALQTALPEIATDDGSRRMLGAAREGNCTMTGGRKYRRTHRRHRRRHTHRRRRGGVQGNCKSDCNHDFGAWKNLGDVESRRCKKCKCVENR